MEFLQIIGWISTRRRVRQNALLTSAMPPLFDRTQIGEEIQCAADLLQRLAEPVGRGRIVAGLDVAPVLLHQRAQIREETLPVRHWTFAERFRQSHRTTHSGSQQFLTEEPADPCGLRRVERHPVQSGYHSERGVNAEVPLCKGTERAMLPRIRVLILSTVERRHRSTEMPLGDHCRSLAGNCEDGHGWSASPAAGRRDVGR